MRYKAHRTDTKPWYKYFWPWFVLFIIFWTFMSGVGMLYFANQDTYSMVDGFSKIGKVITEENKKRQRARELGVRATIIRSADKLQISLSPEELLEDFANLELHIVHPTREDMDKILKINKENYDFTTEATGEIAANAKIKLMNNLAGWAIFGSLASGLNNETILE